LQLFNKTLSQNYRVETYRARSIQISRQKESPIHIDGEARIMPDIINCEILPDSLLVLRKSK
nr:diacylglycerol kinase family lipid kinase [Bacteroidaceae bacterium]